MDPHRGGFDADLANPGPQGYDVVADVTAVPTLENGLHLLRPGGRWRWRVHWTAGWCTAT